MQQNNGQVPTRQPVTSDQPYSATQTAGQIKREMSKVLFMVRGMAILFVVIGHVIGERSSGIRQLYPQDLPSLERVYDFIYTFHMPVFFIVAGLSFALFSYGRGNKLGKLFASRFKRLLIPLFCWAPLYFILRCATGQTQFTVEALFRAVILPDFIFWFFPVLFLISVSTSLLLSYGSVALYCLISILLLVASLLFEGMISTAFYFNFFYAIGFVFGLGLKQADDLPFSTLKKPALTAAIGLAGLVMLIVYLSLEKQFYSVAKLLNGTIGFGILYWIALLANSHRLSAQLSIQDGQIISNWFEHLGRISMSIYLMHVMFGSAGRIILVKLGVMAPGLQLALGFGISLLGSVTLDALLRPRLKLFLYSIGEAKA